MNNSDGKDVCTVRIEVELEKTGDDTFPEFSFVALVEELNKARDTSIKTKEKGDSHFEFVGQGRSGLYCLSR